LLFLTFLLKHLGMNKIHSICVSIFSIILPMSIASEVSAETSGELVWSAPADWEKQPAGMMVLETYQRSTSSRTLKLSISVFPGTVGGDLANVNRWLRQVGQDAVTEDTLPTVLKKEMIAGQEWKIVNLAKDSNGLYVAYTLSGGKSWFFKITGPSDGIKSIEASFRDFLTTVKAKS